VALVVTTRGVSSQTSFANPAFQTVWERSDGLVASTTVNRPWVWGPVPGASLSEPFGGLPGNTHLVQYFDKGRMEINDPNANKNDPFYVTNGRLSVELISGLLQTGLNTFETRAPAAIDLASDADDPSAPTYQSFNGVAAIPGAPNVRTATDQTGQVVRAAIDRQGVTQPWPEDHPDYGVRITHFEPVTQHNIPDVFWDYLNQQTDIIQQGEHVQGPLFFPWFSVTGYPISEAYWSYVKVAGRYTDVLIQVYERRVLTFVPHFASPFKVQMGNIGQHYHEWRYENNAGGTPRPVVPTPTSPSRPPIPNITIDSISYRASIVDINGTACVITNRGQAAQSLNGWWLDSPKWDHVDRFYFPDGVTLQPGASITVHSGPGNNNATNIYMFRTTVMWDQQLYDYAVLYDNFGRQVSDFFPAADQGQPTPPPTGGTPTPQPTQGGIKPTPPPPVSTQTGDATPTRGAPSPNPTQPGPILTPSSTPATSTTPATTGTPTITRTVTPTATATRAP
jgi:hypothetical protein